MKAVPLLSLLLCPALMALEPLVPKTRTTHHLAPAPEQAGGVYLAFPALLALDDEVLVSCKHGRAHARDPGAALDLIRLDRASGKVLGTQSLAAHPDMTMQMGEWVRFPNGDIANYSDVYDAEATLRSGMGVVRSTDGGRTFSPIERVGIVDGVEYGYPFDFIVRGPATWMLVMNFEHLAGGRRVHPAKSRPGPVNVIRSDDNGRTWRFVRGITDELGGAPINESAFMPHGDGFLVTTRGYDDTQWLCRTDAEFRIIEKTDLNADNDFIGQHIGRPRLFEKDGQCYLLGRNWVEKGLMQLALFKLDPATLCITRHVILDNAEKARLDDGYYAQGYWTQRDGGESFHVITYKRSQGRHSPDILRLEFDWAEVR
ncbi:MAG TPA: exo-alpha-sialidase [Verrucomicrobiales bacterium]|nr:exo-alpha-sialidase [Verrucomicrobiales bacterium]HRJ10701.1 sialidase family protein [Prosthecobacter sp.]HRK16304.1 sialidase family protein [Prosthecobacter sp.]